MCIRDSKKTPFEYDMAYTKQLRLDDTVRRLNVDGLTDALESVVNLLMGS